MSQLHQFISTLDKTRIKKLEELPLRGKENEVMQFILRHYQKGLPAMDLQLQKLGLSPTHLYKINSVLLGKCFNCLFGNDIFARLHYLKQCGLIVLMRSEAKSAEKQLKKASSAQKEDFYINLFRLYIDLPFKYFDKKQLVLYGKKYLQHRQNKSIQDELYIEQHILFADCNRCAALRNPEKAFGHSEEKLLKRQKELEKGKHYLALYYSYRTMISYYSYYQKKPSLIKPYLLKCIALKDKIQNYFPIDIGQFLNLMLAERLWTEQALEEAYDLYSLEFAKGIPQNMYGYHAHCEQYSLLCMVLGEYDRAKIILDDVFLPLTELKADIFATRGCLCYAKLFLLTGDYKQAMQFIRNGIEINEKGTYLPFELQLRLLETLTFCKKGDYAFGEKLAGRHLKFVQAQKDKKQLADYEDLFRLFQHYCKKRNKNMLLSKEELLKLEHINKRYLTIYCGLLDL